MPPTVIGFIGKKPPRGLKAIWNSLLKKEGREAVFDSYKANDVRDLQLKLSEMFHLGRRGYVVGEGLEGDLASLLDGIDIGAEKAGKIDTVVNEGGILKGYYAGNPTSERKIARQYELFFCEPVSDTTLAEFE